MIQLKRYTVAGIIFVWITGSLAHFLYAWTGNNSIAGLFTPVNESVWEHMKLLFFPMLLYSFFISVIFKSSRLCIASSLLWGNLAGTLLIPVFYYAYTFILAKNIFILDIGIFILCTLIAFGLSYKLSESRASCVHKIYAALSACLALILLMCFIIFTIRPPGLKIFEDPARTGATSEKPHSFPSFS